MAVIHESCTWYWRQNPVDQSKRLWRSARVQSVLLKRKQRNVRRTWMPLQNSNRRADEHNEAWRFSSADLRRMIESGVKRRRGRNDVNQVMLMYGLLTRDAKPQRCSRWTQSAEDNASEGKCSARSMVVFITKLLSLCYSCLVIRTER